MNELDSPEVKSIFTDLPNAVSAGQLALECLSARCEPIGSQVLTTCERVAIAVGLSRSWDNCPCGQNCEECL